MESWSSQIDKFKIKVFLDTNILCYLVDETYPALNLFIKELGEMPMVDIISSEFVLTEFIGVRKQEHYFREAIKKGEIDDIQINFASLIKNNKRYDIPRLPFTTLKDSIYAAVKADESKITSDYKISFCCGFNRHLLKPTSDICLSSKISKEDSLVLVSAIYADDNSVISNKTLLLTNDNDFHAWFIEAKNEISDIFNDHSINIPHIEHLCKIGNNAGWDIPVLNFTDPKNTDVKNYAIEYIKKLFLNEYKELYIGKIFQEKSSLPEKCFCFKAEIDTKIPNNSYIVIIDSNLHFVYCSEHPVCLWQNKAITDDSITCADGNNNLSFMLDADLDNSVLTKLKGANNLIFIHPDN